MTRNAFIALTAVLALGVATALSLAPSFDDPGGNTRPTAHRTVPLDRIVVLVTGPGGAAVRSAQVEVLDHDQRLATGTTDALGRVTLAPDCPGPFRVRVQAKELAPSLLDFVRTGRSIHLVLARARQVHGQLTPQQLAHQVRAVIARTQDIELRASVDGDGGFAFANLPNDRPVVLLVDSDAVGAPPRSLGTSETRVEMQLSPFQVRDGRVLALGSDRPIAGAEIRVSEPWNRRPTGGPATTTGPDGSFHVAVKDGAVLHVRARGFLEFDEATADRSAPNRAPSRTIRLARAKAMTFALVRPDDRPAKLTTLDLAGQRIETRSLAGPGPFRLTPSALPCWLRLTADGCAPIVRQITPGDPEHLGTFELEIGATIDGKITPARPGTWVEITGLDTRDAREARLRRGIRTDADGSFRVTELPSGRITMRARGSAWRSREVTVMARAGATAAVELPLIDLHALHVEVREQRGKPVAGARVESACKTAESWNRDAATTDAHGRAELLVLAGLQVTLRVRGPGFDELREKLDARGGASSTTLVRVTRKTLVRGRILDPNGQPAAARVALVRNDGTAYRSRSDAAGWIVPMRIPEGTYDVVVEGPNAALRLERRVIDTASADLGALRLVAKEARPSPAGH